MIGDIISQYPKTVKVFEKFELFCVMCPMARQETLEEGATSHGIIGDKFEIMLKELNDSIV